MPLRYTPLTTDGDATESMSLSYGQRFCVSAWGTWTGELVVQRSFNGADWTDVEVFTENFERDGLASAPMRVRILARTLSSGTAQCGRYTDERKSKGAA